MCFWMNIGAKKYQISLTHLFISNQHNKKNMSLNQQIGIITFIGEEFTQEAPLYQGVNLIGRNQNKCNIIVRYLAISDVHAKIVCRKNKITIMDVKSKNGVFINTFQEKLESGKEVQINPDQDIVYISDLECKFKFSESFVFESRKEDNKQNSTYKQNIQIGDKQSQPLNKSQSLNKGENKIKKKGMKKKSQKDTKKEEGDEDEDEDTRQEDMMKEENNKKQDKRKKKKEEERKNSFQKSTKNHLSKQKEEKLANQEEKKQKKKKPRESAQEKKAERNKSNQTLMKKNRKKLVKSEDKHDKEPKEKNGNIRRKRMQQVPQQHSYPIREIVFKRVLLSGFKCSYIPFSRIIFVDHYTDTFDVLVMQRYERTFKLLYSICKGIPIVASSWLDECQYRRTIIPFTKFYLPGRQRQVILNSLQKVNQGQKIFKDEVFCLFSQNYHLPIEQITQLISECGGTTITLTKKRDGKQNKKIKFILSQTYKPDEVKQIQKIAQTKNIFEIQLILDSCLRQEVKWDQFRIKI